MLNREMQRLVEEVEAKCGRVRSYTGDSDDGNGTSFIIPGTPATFSVHTQEGALPPGQYDIQIESIPPGDYVFTSVVSLARFLELVEKVRGPLEQWPQIDVDAR